ARQPAQVDVEGAHAFIDAGGVRRLEQRGRPHQRGHAHQHQQQKQTNKFHSYGTMVAEKVVAGKINHPRRPLRAGYAREARFSGLRWLSAVVYRRAVWQMAASTADSYSAFHAIPNASTWMSLLRGMRLLSCTCCSVLRSLCSFCSRSASLSNCLPNFPLIFCCSASSPARALCAQRSRKSRSLSAGFSTILSVAFLRSGSLHSRYRNCTKLF